MDQDDWIVGNIQAVSLLLSSTRWSSADTRTRVACIVVSRFDRVRHVTRGHAPQGIDDKTCGNQIANVETGQRRQKEILELLA